MRDIKKKVVAIGNSAGVAIGKKVLLITGIEIGDVVRVIPSKNKIVIIKED